MLKDSRVIAITGFMAAGKTAVGRALAEQLERVFIDLDEVIVQREGRSISEIIEAEGEPSFRDIETEVLREVLQEPSACVVALGGGTSTIAENRTLLQRAEAHVVWLDTPFELCWKRIETSGGARPLASSRELAERLYSERQSLYQLATSRVQIEESMTIADCARAISSLFKQKPISRSS